MTHVSVWIPGFIPYCCRVGGNEELFSNKVREIFHASRNGFAS
jgi:hypothetical protein